MEELAGHCVHVVEAFQDRSVLEKYRTVVSWSAKRSIQSSRPLAKRRRISPPTCNSCSKSLYRPFACLHCEYIGCWQSAGCSGARSHLNGKDHKIAVDATSGAVYCSLCTDIVYVAPVDNILRDVVSHCQENATLFQVKNARRARYEAWVPASEDLAALNGSEVIPCYKTRGLVNLGQTCFLNVVLQAFIANPLLRNYFLGDRHNRYSCKIDDCACCEMDQLFSEVYAPTASPYGPVTFLSTTWRKSSELSGYAQQDAHEFFISTLNNIHSTSRGSTNVSCNCIVHSTFAGSLQSDVRCERCQNVTTTVDPMMDISLELKGPENTLIECLKRFTQPEKLGSKDYSCVKCGRTSHDVNKQLSVQKLPPVICFQFKRFEQKTVDTTRKLDGLIQFPSNLNMKPFTTIGMKENGASEKENAGPDSLYEYDLFAVINHEGQLNNGHYTNYARCGEKWYRFDDDKVTPSSLAACLNPPSFATAYMCFYVKRHLDYRPHSVPSYATLAKENGSPTKAVEAEDPEDDDDMDRSEREDAEREREVEDELLSMV